MQIFISHKADGGVSKSPFDEGSTYHEKPEQSNQSQKLETQIYPESLFMPGSVKMDLPQSFVSSILTENMSVMEVSNVAICNYTHNPWCGQFGSQQRFEVIYLVLLTILGIFGNLLVIFSIILEKKLHKHANIFIVNLAVADFLAAGIYTPFVIANVFAGGLGYPFVVCEVVGYLIITACSSSMWNLAFIAANRFTAITYRKQFRKIFSKNKSYLMVIFSWLWSIFLGTPTLFGWTNLAYDYKSMVCTWDDSKAVSYSLFIIFGAILIPLAATIFFYWKLFWHVRIRSQTSRRVFGDKNQHKQHKAPSEIKKKTLRREINLLKTLATAVILFVLCWTPYSFCVLINPTGINPLIKKICTWLGLQNSAINFIIYGVMNQGYREGYKKLLDHLLCRRRKRRNICTSPYSSRTSGMLSITNISTVNSSPNLRLLRYSPQMTLCNKTSLPEGRQSFNNELVTKRDDWLCNTSRRNT